MLVIGMATLFAGYAVGSYGWVLLKGWNIPFRAWVSPLHPYEWPAGGADPPPIPADKLFPSSAAGAAASTTAAEQRGQRLTPAEQRAKSNQQAGRDLPARLGP